MRRILFFWKKLCHFIKQVKFNETKFDLNIISECITLSICKKKGNLKINFKMLYFLEKKVGFS